jgi:hypothetical protein
MCYGEHDEELLTEKEHLIGIIIGGLIVLGVLIYPYL